jgi:hypothetical protein
MREGEHPTLPFHSLKVRRSQSLGARLVEKCIGLGMQPLSQISSRTNPQQPMATTSRNAAK